MSANIVNSGDLPELPSTGVSALDSFRIRIPIEFVRVTNPELESRISQYYVDTSTEYPEDDSLKRCVPVQRTGYRFKFDIKLIPTSANTRKRFLVIQINSKMLESGYFNGVNKHNIKDIYDSLMSLKTVYVSYNDFLDGVATDVDIKKDFYASNLREISKALAMKVTNLGYRKHTIHPNSKGGGISFNERGKATPSQPFLKIYNKTKELKENSTKFNDTHLKGVHSSYETKNLCRIEVTVKNKNAVDYHKIPLESMSLREWLNLGQTELNRIFAIMARKYFRKVETPPEGLQPADLILLELLKSHLANYKDLAYSAELITSLIDNEKSRARYRTKIYGLYEKYIATGAEGQAHVIEAKKIEAETAHYANQADSILSMIGI